MSSPSLLFTSESVTEGHPDKLCDQISDAVVDAYLAADPRARVACEVAATTGLVTVIGEITSTATVDVPELVRRTIRDVGYTHPDYGLDADTCAVIVSLKGQSPDIAQGVNRGLEARQGEMTDAEVEALGAGDQGMMIGFACDETAQFMPLPIALAHALCQRLTEVRKMGLLPFLRPDGKSQVTVEYQFGKPVRVDTVVIAAQHHPEVDADVMREALHEHVIRYTIPAHLLDSETKYHVNATGRFVLGGPAADAGLTGRKIIVDTYGGIARHGGGAFSGKDPTKVDRSAAYAARYVAKNLVAAGVADRLEIQLSYAIGVAQPLSVSVETFGTARIPEARIMELAREFFDLRPGAIIRDLDLRRPLFRQTAAYGHFGREDLGVPWELTDKVDLIREAAGLDRVLASVRSPRSTEPA